MYILFCFIDKIFRNKIICRLIDAKNRKCGPAYKLLFFFSLGLTKTSYVETVIKGIQQCKNEGVDIDVR